MWLNDAISGTALVLFAIAEIAYATTFPTLHGQAYGPSLFPVLIGCCLMACGFVLIFRGLRTRRSQARAPASRHPQADAGTKEAVADTADPVWIRFGDWANSSSRRINMALVPGSLIVYILLSNTIGFMPLSIVILSVLLYRLGSSLLLSLGIAVATSILLQLLFAKVLLVPLPAGLLLRWLG